MKRLIQLAFDFLDSGPVTVPVPAPLPVSMPPARPQPPVAAAPSVPVGTAATERSPAGFAHPRANREAVLGDCRIGYEFRRARRRTIGFVVGPDGLVVSAPNWVTLRDVDAALKEKSAWIVRKLAETRERAQRLASAQIDWRDGASLPFLGESLTLVIDPRHDFKGVGAALWDVQPVKNVQDVAAVQGEQGAEGSQGDSVARALHLGLPGHASAEQIRDAAQAWLMREARAVFTVRLNHFAPQLGVQWRKLSLSSAGTRWGSANSSGAIRLNWRLIHFRLSVIDYVVAHELSHLRVMDHSPRFWDTVAAVMPDYAALRGELKSEAIPRW